MSSAAPGRLTKLPCPKPPCSGSIGWETYQCSICLATVPPPNIRWADAERADLDQRYEAALKQLEAKGAEALGAAYEAAANRSMAIFSVPPDYALNLLDERRLHQNYHQGVDGGARAPADYHDDVTRRAVDSQIFGSAGRKISMAALSLEPLGLPSYGAVSMQFHENFCMARASLLSENSFDFVARYPGGPSTFPAGHRATWSERGRLALIKAVDHLSAGTDPASFQEILLTAGATRRNDRFIEVHIFESWNIEAVVGMKVRVSSLRSAYDHAMVQELGDRLHAKGISWEVVA